MPPYITPHCSLPSRPPPFSKLNQTITSHCMANPDPADYSASKSAVINLMQTSAYQLQGTSIRCNALCPGVIETGMTRPMYEAARAKGVEKKIGQLNPLKRGGTAGEVARTVLWLAGEGAGYLNAQAVAVDGGLSGSLPVVPGRFY